MSQVRWLSQRMVEAIHREAIARFGGADGIRDEGLLASALARPRALWDHGRDPTVFALAARYCVAIICNHPFIDGNKRAGLLAAAVFLSLNGYRFEPREAVAVEMIWGVAAGSIDEKTLVRWLSEHAIRKDAPPRV